MAAVETYASARSEETDVDAPWYRPFRRWPRIADGALAVFAFVGNAFVSDEPSGMLVLRTLAEVPVAALVAMAIASGALVWRRHRPLPVLWTALLASIVTLVAGTGPAGAVLFAVYAAGRYAEDGPWHRAAMVLVLVIMGATALLDTVTLGDAIFGAILAQLLWYVGRRFRWRRERDEQLLRERQADARRALAEERTRIARELHDVVAHGVSLMTVQAGAARTIAAVDLDRAVDAMAAVEQTGREVLGELRHLLGVLRPDTAADELGPQPELADVPRLVDQFADAGLRVRLDVDGVDGRLSAPVELSAYRIVQEALTNVFKHAGPDSRADVRIRQQSGELTIEVTDDGRGATLLPGSGQGIAGMRERAQLLGGHLDVGPQASGGFRVSARLPIHAEAL